MDNTIEAFFAEDLRSLIFQNIKKYGTVLTETMMLGQEFHPSFIKAIIRNISKKEGW